MKYSRVKTGQGLLWSLLGILLYVLAHSIPEWDAPYAAPGRLELSLTLAGLALLLARIQWLIPILAAVYLLSILLEIVWMLGSPPNGSHDVVFGTSSALLVPVIHLANWLAQVIQSQALPRFALVPLCLAAVICLAPAWQYLRRIRETDPDKLEEMRKRLQ